MNTKQRYLGQSVDEERKLTRARCNYDGSIPQLSLTEAHWIKRCVDEVGYRLHLVFFAPTLKRSAEITRRREHREKCRIAEEYSKGYLAGWHECYGACLEAVEQELSKEAEVWEVGELFANPESLLKTN